MAAERDRVYRIILDTLEAVALSLLENGVSLKELENLMDQAQYLAITEYERRYLKAEGGH